MKKTKRVLAILIVCMLVASISACNKDDKGTTDTSSPPPSSGESSTQQTGGNETQASEQPGSSPAAAGRPTSTTKDSVTIAVTQDRGTLDPLYMVGWDTMQAMRLVYEPLWEYDVDYQEVKWVLATSVDMIEPTVWIINLRDDVYFTNGNKFTADDVIFSLYIANNRAGEPPYFLTMDNEANRKIDDYTVEIHYTEYNVGYMFSYATIFMFDEESYNFDTVGMESMGTGPYLMTDYVINSHMTFELREDGGYWGTPPLIKNIDFVVLGEAAQRVNALQTGAVDISGVPFQDIDFVETFPDMEILMGPTRGNSTIYCNCSNPGSPFYDNIDARRAIFYAIDTQAILDIVFQGYGELSRCAYTIFAADANPRDFDKGIYGHGYDPELARELAISSGIADYSKSNVIRFINNGGANEVTIAELVQANLKDIGIDVTIQSMDAGSWLDYRFDATSYDMCVDFTGGSPAAVDLSVWWSFAGNVSAQGIYPDVGMERYLEMAEGIRQISDQDTLWEYYSEMTDLLAEVDLFYNVVETVYAVARNNSLHYDRISAGWIDWSTAYWS